MIFERDFDSTSFVNSPNFAIIFLERDFVIHPNCAIFSFLAALHLCNAPPLRQREAICACYCTYPPPHMTCMYPPPCNAPQLRRGEAICA